MTERTRRYRLGHYAESISVWHLRLRGYRVLARRYRTPVGEIDIIARRGKLIAFIEVKARRTKALAIESITLKQRRHIRRAAGAFLSAHPTLTNCDLRFDIILVTPWALPAHITDAWRD